MSALFFALSQEAKPWIDALQLKPEKRQGHFRYYHNDLHTIAISGPGKLSMAMAVTELAHKIPKNMRHPGYRVWNLGICGSANKKNKIGDFFWIHKIHDFAQKRDYYPEQIESGKQFPESHLTTFDRPISRDQNANSQFFQTLPASAYSDLELVDMEASAFYEAASIYYDLHHIQIGKVVSDHLEGLVCNPSQVTEWMEKTKKELFEHFCSPGVNLEKEVLSKEEWDSWHHFAKELHFTESMLADIKKSIQYFKLRNPQTSIPRPLVDIKDRAFEKKDAKAIFSQWRKVLHA